MRQYLGLGLIVLSLPLIIFGVLGTTQTASVILGVALAGTGIVLLALGYDDRRRIVNFDAVLKAPDPPLLREVPKPPPLPKVDDPATDEVPRDAAPPVMESSQRPETMLPPQMEKGSRTNIRLVHTDGKKLVLRNRPKKTGSYDE